MMVVMNFMSRIKSVAAPVLPAEAEAEADVEAAAGCSAVVVARLDPPSPFEVAGEGVVKDPAVVVLLALPPSSSSSSSSAQHLNMPFVSWQHW